MHKTKLIFQGKGALRNLGVFLPKYKDVLVFTDKNGFVPSGASAYFEEWAKQMQGNIRFHYFPYAGKALPLEDIERIYTEVRLVSGADLIVAVGGGTVIDLAKIISIAYANGCLGVAEILDQPHLQNTLDLIFIPTTCGTGSEATSFAVVYRDKVKLSIENPSVLPDYVMLDPFLLRTLPEPVLNSVILDALAQAVESVWAPKATYQSRDYARDAIQDILDFYPGDPTPRRFSRLLWASYLAGRAINITRTTLSHSISYPMTAHFGVPHGIAVFLTLPEVAQFNYFATAESLQPGLYMTDIEKSFDFLFDVFDVDTIEEFTARLKVVMSRLGFGLRLQDHGITKEALPFLADNSLSQGRSDNNPRIIDKQTVLEMLERLF